MAHLLEVNRAAVLEKFGKTDREVQEDVAILREWLKTQPHLPSIDDVRLEKMLANCKFSLQTTKQTVDAYFTIRSFLRDFFADMDPLNPSLQNAFRVATKFPLKKQTKDYERVFLTKFWDLDLEKYNALLHAKCIVMIEELRAKHDYEFGNHVIIDMDGVKFGHLSRFTPDIILKITKLFIGGYKFRYAGIHIVNAPSYVDVLLKALKVALSEKIYSRLVVHKTLASLHERISKELLPSDLGGDQPPSYELNEEWIKEVEKNRDWFLAMQNNVVDESKRPGDLHDVYFGSIHGTFKTLAVD